MCGICGFYGLNDSRILKRMNNIIKHRGPDHTDFFTDKDIGLSNQRLSIIGLNKGNQPMHNEDESIWLTFNGEIYNFKELKYTLEKKGHKFYSDSDTEVIIHAYEEYGENCVKHFNGMFAFAIWDSNKKQLFLARDRLGIKPLYYSFMDGKFFFASEIKSLMQCRLIKKEINYNSLNSFFTFRYVSGENTIINGIKRLLPGNTLTYKNKKIRIKQYWDLHFNLGNKSDEYYINSFKKLFEDSVKKRLMSEVPLGLFLSGGIDSTSILSYASRFSDKPIKTFNLSFSEWPDNETDYAKQASQFFNTDHKEVSVNSEIIKILPKVIWYMDEPVADPTAILNYVLAEKAKKYVKVILMGEGSDEIFGGYEQYKIMKITENYNKIIPNFIQKSLINSLTRILPKENFFIKLSNYLNCTKDTSKSCIELLSIFNRSEKELLYSYNLNKKISNSSYDIDIIRKYFKNSYDIINKMALFDIKNWLPNNMLLKVDRTLMANSIEGRVPFLDHRIVELSSKIPPRLKLRGLNEKVILKKAMRNNILASIIKRKKQRFFVPIDFWFNENLDYIKDIILADSEFISNNFDKNFIEKLLNYKKTSSHKFILSKNKLLNFYYPRQIWTLMTFFLWYKIYIENDMPKSLNRI
jgi:asparagine synthase (glutamine-hydrolysing)